MPQPKATVEEDIPGPSKKGVEEDTSLIQKKEVIEVTPKGGWSTKVNEFTSIFSSDNIFAFVIFILFVSFLVAFWRAQRKQNLQWTDLITKIGSNSVSLTKMLQLIGGIVATWIMVKMTVQEKLTWEIFGLYLAYVASIEGYSKYISAKYSDKLSLGAGRLPQDYNSPEDDEEQSDLYRKSGKTKLPPID